MKLKKEYLVLLVIIAVLSIYLVTRSKDQTNYELPRPAQVDSQKINRLVITKAGQSIELNKKDEQWYVGPNAYPADSIKARNMVKAVSDLDITDLISESGNYDRYSLTDDQRVKIRAYTGDEMVRDFDIGKEAPTNQHTFTRLGDDPNVYQARGRLDDTFDHTVDDLRDLTVLSFQKDDIISLSVQKGAQSLTLSRKEPVPAEETEPADDQKPAEQKESSPQPQWQDPEGKTVDQAAVAGILRDFSSYKCDKYLGDDAADGLKAQTPIVMLTFKGEKETFTLSVFDTPDAESNEYPAISSDTPYAFMIAKSKVEAVDKQLDKLLNSATK